MCKQVTCQEGSTYAGLLVLVKIGNHNFIMEEFVFYCRPLLLVSGPLLAPIIINFSELLCICPFYLMLIVLINKSMLQSFASWQVLLLVIVWLSNSLYPFKLFYSI